jgi:hypothetical protein
MKYVNLCSKNNRYWNLFYLYASLARSVFNPPAADCAFSIVLRLTLEPDMIEDCQQKKIVCLPLYFKV